MKRTLLALAALLASALANMMNRHAMICGLLVLASTFSTAIAAKEQPVNPLAGKPLAELTKILKTSDSEPTRIHAVGAISANVSGKTRTGGKPPKEQPTYVDADAKVVAALVAGLGDKASSVRYACREALGRCGTNAVAPLVAVLADKNDEVRDNAAAALGDIGVYNDADAMPLEQAIPGLTKLLADENYAVRVSAAMAVSRIGVRGAPAIDKLIKLLDDDEWPVIEAAVRAVAAVDPDGTKSVPALVKVLDNKTHDHRQFVCEELAAMGARAEGAIPALIKLLDTDRNSWQAGKAAANALTAIIALDPKSPDAPTVSAETRTIVISAVAKSAADPTKVPFVQNGRLYALLPKVGRSEGYTGPLGAEALPALPVALTRLQEWLIPYRHWVPRRQVVNFIAAVAPHAENKDEVVKIVQDLLAHKDFAGGVDERLQATARKELETLLTKLQAK